MEAHMQKHKEQGDLDSLIDYPASILCEEARFSDITNVLQETFQARAYPDADKIISAFNNEDEFCCWDLRAKD